MARTLISLASLAILGSMLFTYGPAKIGYIVGVGAFLVLFVVANITLRRFAIWGGIGRPTKEQWTKVSPAPSPEKRRAA